MIIDKFFGKPISGGIAAGKLYVFTHDECPVRRYHIDSSAHEIMRFEKARAEAASELDKLFHKAAKEIDEENARIFSSQIVMIEDSGFTESVYDAISDQMINAETAVAQTSDKYIQMFIESENEYIGSRSYDIKDISERIIRILLGIQLNELSTNEPVIIAAHDLPPSDIVRFDNDKILGFIVEEGIETSHAAILAKSKNVPAIIQAGSFLDRIRTGADAIIDGNKGILYVDPDEDVKSFLLS